MTVKNLENTAKRIGQNVFQLRTKKKMSQSELAEESNMAQSTISEIESGEHFPQLANAQAIADALGVKLASLVK